MSYDFDHGSEALDRYLDGEEQDYPFGGDYGGEVLECRNCGEWEVEWKQLPSGKWWLHEENEAGILVPHKCKSRRSY